MGFPDWTLWGMGISALTALIALALSLVGQSPQFLRRSGLSNTRLDLRVRTFTAIAFALLLLSFGFFVAGVPIGNQAAGAVSLQENNSAATAFADLAPGSPEPGIVGSSEPPALASATRATPATGSFDGPPISTSDAPQRQTEVAAESLSTPEPSDSPAQESATPRSSATTSLTSSQGATSTPPPSPTVTPTPSLTPTPILDETTQIETQGSTVWIKRSPGGQNLVLAADDDLVFILSGHANQGGIIWREIRTLEGLVGWIQEEFLFLEE
jgi:hypothetical protein